MKVSQKKILLLFLVLLLIGGAFFFVPRKRPLMSYLNRAEEAFQDKEFNRSIELYLQALKYYPNHERNPDILLTIGDIYNFSLGNPDKAGTAYEMVTEKYSKTIFSRKALQNSGEMYEKDEQYQRALLSYQGIVDAFPSAGDVDEIRYRVAMMALKLKKFEPARRSLMAIVETNPNTMIADKVLYELGNIFFREGAHKQSVQVLKVAVEKFPESPLNTEMKFSLANAYEEQGHLEKALKIYRSILENYPNPQVVKNKIENIEGKHKEKREMIKKIQETKNKAKKDSKAKGVSTQKRRKVGPLNNNDGALSP